MSTVGQVISAMIDYYEGDVRRINHFLKVYGLAKSVGEMEGLDKRMQEILEIAAVTHDIGIKNSEQKYNSAAGNYQQIEGPPEAQKLLENMSFDSSLIDRVCWLIAHHHTYNNINEIDYQILIEADFLVNAFEDHLSEAAIKNFSKKIFKTETGKKFLSKLKAKDDDK
ncbi:MAG: HD domain-containing protein [Dehalobacter sp. 4CP]|uniref:HD domain-containing protein n=1 Tax=Dehalobacter sp. CP TaxID=2594474 RepID=UPI0013CD94A0|nr:HD domain-containing protein [Dehalobacter sp. 4CP]